ncbi:replication factor C subunit 5-like [Impatiens glandulifera]|uniref:replication factor C subunit 5-like n=1 Tax=Impatiens glandulifera TaxID=253017 RepID=UPI001FB0D403|nr:replication factor C subunit 5-like [Impatiens glandulifera]
MNVLLNNQSLLLQNKEEHHCGHFIFEGPPGVGKRTMITALLRDTFGQDKVQATEQPITFLLKGEAIGSIEVKAKVSSQHVEVNIDKVKGYEKHVIIDLIKENSNRLPNVSMKCRREERRAIVLYEADQISADVLPYIRWLLEKYRGRNSLFFCCTKASKLQSLTSLCTVVQLNAPSIENIVDVLKFIAKKEGIDLPLNLAVRIANNSKNNLRQAIRSFEATWNCSPQLKEDQEIKTGWEDDIEDIARSIIEEQSPKQLYIIRRKLQNILEHNVSLEFFFMTLMRELMKHLPDQLQTQMEKMHKDYIDRLEEMNKRQKDPIRRNAQHFLRIEAFIAKFMSWYKATAVNRRI